MSQREADIKKVILKWLNLNGILSFPVRTTGTPNPRGKGFIPLQVKGISDILGIIPPPKRFSQFGGIPLAVEVKRPGGKLTIHQKVFLDDWNKAGGLGFVANSLDIVIKTLNPYLTFNQEVPFQSPIGGG